MSQPTAAAGQSAVGDDSAIVPPNPEQHFVQIHNFVQSTINPGDSGLSDTIPSLLTTSDLHEAAVVHNSCKSMFRAFEASRGGVVNTIHETYTRIKNENDGAIKLLSKCLVNSGFVQQSALFVSAMGSHSDTASNYVGPPYWLFLNCSIARILCDDNMLVFIPQQGDSMSNLLLPDVPVSNEIHPLSYQQCAFQQIYSVPMCLESTNIAITPTNLLKNSCRFIYVTFAHLFGCYDKLATQGASFQRLRNVNQYNENAAMLLCGFIPNSRTNAMQKIIDQVDAQDWDHVRTLLVPRSQTPFSMPAIEIIANRFCHVLEASAIAGEKFISYRSVCAGIRKAMNTAQPRVLPKAPPTQSIQKPQIFRVAHSSINKNHPQVKDGLEALAGSDAVYLQRHLVPVRKHACDSINQKLIDRWYHALINQELQSIRKEDYGSMERQPQVVFLPYNDGSNASESQEKTFVFAMRNIFSDKFRIEIINSIDESPFLADSGDVGAGKRDRFYRVVQGNRAGQAGTALFQLSNEPRPMGSAPMTAIEAKLIHFISELIAIHDCLVEEANAVGAIVYQWQPSRTVAPTMVARGRDSTYRKHQDNAFHHCHNLSTLEVLEDDGVQNSVLLDHHIFMSIPHQNYMRVFTIILSLEEGDNATLRFTPADSDRTLSDFIVTNHCSFHYQSFMCQSAYKHHVESIGSVSNRIVITARQNLPGDDWNLTIHAARTTVQNDTSKLSNPRDDYSITGVVSYCVNDKPLVHVENKKRPSSDNDQDNAGQGLFKKSRHETQAQVQEEQQEYEESKAVSSFQSAICSDPDPFSQNVVSSVKQIKEDPPGGDAVKLIEDSKKMSERIVHHVFVKHFINNRIRVRLSVPASRASKSGTQTVKHSTMGSTEAFHIVCNPARNEWHPVNEPGYRPIVPGDIILESKVRSVFELQEGEKVKPLWRTGSHYLTNCAILSQFVYKDDLRNILHLVQKLNIPGQDIHNSSFWMGGSGGSAQPLGAQATSTGDLSGDNPKATGSFPHPMDPSSNLNSTMLQCCSHGQVLHVFVPLPASTLHIMDKKYTDPRDQKIVRDRGMVVFLGLFKVKSASLYSALADEALSDMKESMAYTLINNRLQGKGFLQSNTDRDNEASQSFDVLDSVDTMLSTDNIPEDEFASWKEREWWNFSFRLDQHFRFQMELLDVNWDAFYNRRDEPVTECPLSIDGPLANQRLLFQVSKDAPTSETFLSTTNFHSQVLLDRFVDEYEQGFLVGLGKLPQEKLQEALQTSVGDNTQEESGPADDNLQARKLSNLKSKSNIKVGVKESIGLLIRLTAAGAYRACGVGAKRNNDGVLTSVGYIPDNTPPLKALGQVIRSSPTPLPDRSLDLATSFGLSLVLETMEGTFQPQDREQNFGCLFSPAQPWALTLRQVESILTTFFIIRLTGRVERLRHYLCVTKKANGQNWKRLFDVADLEGLGQYALGLYRQKNGDVKKRNRMTRASISNTMNLFATTQYKRSLPTCVTHDVNIFRNFLTKCAPGISKFSTAIHGSSVNHLTRASVIQRLKVLINDASNNQEKDSSLEFIAGQITADLELVFTSGRKDSRSAPQPIFSGERVVTGYGGGEGLGVMGRGLPEFSKKKVSAFPPSNTTSEEAKDRYHKLVLEVSEEYIKELSKIPSQLLKCANLFLDRDNVLCSLTNGMPVTVVLVEHNGCKFYIVLHRCRGTRYFTVPNTWRPHCQPAIHDDTLHVRVVRHFRTLIEFYESIVNLGKQQPNSLPELHPYFCYPKESPP